MASGGQGAAQMNSRGTHKAEQGQIMFMCMRQSEQQNPAACEYMELKMRHCANCVVVLTKPKRL